MNKTILITGSTDGIGKLAAIKLAKDGHHILIHGRDELKVQNTVAEIISITGHENVKAYVADLSDFAQIDQMIDTLNASAEQLDVLINNAGVYKSENEKQANGFDLRFMVNYLAPYYMTNRLLPMLKGSSDPRIINLSSAAQSEVSLEALAGKQSISTQQAYAQSKLALTMWSTALAQQLENWTVIPVNPGSLLDTKMVREAFGRTWSSADKGANILYDLTIENKYKGIQSEYFDNDQGEKIGRFSKAHADAYDQELINSLLLKTDEIIASINQ